MVWTNAADMRADDLFTEMWRLAIASKGWLAAYLLILTGLGVAADYSSSASGMNFGLNIVQIAFAYWVTVRLMANGGLLPDGPQRGFGGYFGLALLSGIGIMLGFVLLVLPGLFLLIRWLPAYGFLFAGDAGASRSLELSWQATKPHFVALAVATIVPVVLIVMAIAVFSAPEFLPDTPIWPIEITGNLLSYLGSIAWTLLGIASYSLLSNSNEGVREVFV